VVVPESPTAQDAPTEEQ
jgi:hypothetical protein